MNNFLNIGFTKLASSFESLIQRCKTISALVELAQQENYELYLVGGFLRDIFLGKSSKDVDFVSKESSKLASLVERQTGSKAVLIDRKFGTLRFIPPVRPNGIGEPWVIDLSPLRGSSIFTDLCQRDFTLNSLALDVSGWWNARVPHLLDPLGGIADLEAGRLRLCSQTSLSDDPLRILRAYRLVSTYGFVLTAQTHENIVQVRTGLNRVAVERIRDELMLILGEKFSVSVLRMLNEDDLLKLLLPEYEDMGNLQQNHSHHEDPWQHSLSALKALEFLLINIPQLLGNYGDEASAILAQNLGGKRSRQTLLKLAVLLQNIGKPHNKSPGKDGAIHYDGHEVTRAKLAASLCSRLRLSNKEINFVGQLVGQHKGSVHLFNLTPPSTQALCSFFRLGPELFWPLLLLFAANYRAFQKPTATESDLQPLPQLIQGWLDFYYERLKPREMEPPIVSGHDLMEYFDLSPGPLVGKLLKYLAELQWQGRITTQEEALDQGARLLKQLKQRSQKRGDRGRQSDCS